MNSVPSQELLSLLATRRDTLVLQLGPVQLLGDQFVGAKLRSAGGVGYVAVTDSLLIMPRIPPDPVLPRLDLPAAPPVPLPPARPEPRSERRERSSSTQRALLATFGGFASGLLFAWLSGLF
jgi:hypothetical protein